MRILFSLVTDFTLLVVAVNVFHMIRRKILFFQPKSLDLRQDGAHTTYLTSSHAHYSQLKLRIIGAHAL